MTESDFWSLTSCCSCMTRLYGSMVASRESRTRTCCTAHFGRPVNKLAYADPDVLNLFDLAVAYVYGLASNHPFNDGNKRTAWSSCVLFLKVNGADINLMARDAVEQMVRLATKSVDKSGFAAWQRQS